MIKLTLVKEKETPGTIRFKEEGDEDRPLIIYLTKDRVAELGDPETITVTIEKA
jgi:hypothetical protein